MPGKVLITSLGANGVYHSEWGKMDPDFPTMLTTKEGKFSLMERPLFPNVKPTRLGSFQELYSADTPAITPVKAQLRMLTELNSRYPIAPTSKVDWTERRFERETVHRQGVQRARSLASRTNERNQAIGMMGMVAMFAVGIFTVIFAIIALTVLSERQSAEELAPAVMGPERTIRTERDINSESARPPDLPMSAERTNRAELHAPLAEGDWEPPKPVRKDRDALGARV